jgi:hypothetical protein
MVLNNLGIDKIGRLIYMHKTWGALDSPKKITHFVSENQERNDLLQGVMTVRNTGTFMEPA